MQCDVWVTAKIMFWGPLASHYSAQTNITYATLKVIIFRLILPILTFRALIE